MSQLDQSDRRIRVGLAGLGRSGWNIHAAAMKVRSSEYQIVATVDPESARCEEAQQELGARPCASVEQLVADPEVELVVVATPNRFHAEHALAALAAGKHVVVEKPVANAVEEMDQLIAVSEKAGCVFAPFQNRRYDPHFQKVQEIVASGVLGRLVQIRMAAHGFTRRWDWQTLTEFGGGTLNNSGPHFLDQALQIFGPHDDPEVSCYLDSVLTLGNADDHAVLQLQAPGAPLLQVEMSSVCALPQDLWLIMGEQGTLRGDPKRLQWKTTTLAELPSYEVQRGAAEGRRYTTEQLDWQEHEWTVPEDQASIHWTRQRFYEDLYQTIRHGQPLKVTPQSVRQQIDILDRARAVASTSRREVCAI